jgi:hypothetical protein
VPQYCGQRPARWPQMSQQLAATFITCGTVEGGGEEP